MTKADTLAEALKTAGHPVREDLEGFDNFSDGEERTRDWLKEVDDDCAEMTASWKKARISMAAYAKANPDEFDPDQGGTPFHETDHEIGEILAWVAKIKDAAHHAMISAKRLLDDGAPR